MAIKYYDDAIIQKLKKWIPENSSLRVLKPDESKRLFELIANDNNDKPLTLPFIALSRNNDIELLSNTKSLNSFNGLKLAGGLDSSLLMNIIPIKAEYQLDIYTKTMEEGEEYLRTFLFKLINNPKIIISVPYNNQYVSHTANIRVLSSVSDTSSIGERIFSGQFTRWSIQLELQDGFLFSIPYKSNWKIGDVDVDVTERINKTGEIEHVWSDTED